MDVKLSLGYLSCVFAGIASWYGYVNSFEESRTITAVCVAAYFVLNSILYLYTTFVEKSTVFVGLKKDAKSKVCWTASVLTVLGALEAMQYE